VGVNKPIGSPIQRAVRRWVGISDLAQPLTCCLTLLSGYLSSVGSFPAGATMDTQQFIEFG